MRSFRDDISEDEIRSLLGIRLRSARQRRIENFHKTGRLGQLDSEDVLSYASLRSAPLANPAARKLSPPRRSPVDRLLLFLEWLAMLGFASIVASGLGVLRNINQASALAFELPALMPTPLVQAVVIPSGHTPPTSPGGTRPNDEEIPAHLRPLVQSYAKIPIPTQALQHGIRIRIPAIDVDAPIVQGDGWEQLKKGVAQRLGSADPGRNGNMVLSGHNDVFGEVFRHLDRLNPGDEITLYTQQRAYTYIVTGWELVEPDQVDVMDPTPDATITLISCYPYLIDTERIIVKGQLVG